MSHRIEATGEIDAPIELVYGVVADVASYPEFVPNIECVTQQGDVVEMTVRLGPLALSWTSRTTFQPHESITATLVEGPFAQLDVVWAFSARGQKTEVTYVTEYDLVLPLPGIDRLAARAIEANAADTIRAFRRRIRELQSTQS
jgi:ribosome-associated toxin RatA of RatAB toxin-antitoxin module